MAKKGNRGAARKTTRPPVQGTANSGTNTQEKKSPAATPAEVPKTTIEDVKVLLRKQSKKSRNGKLQRTRLKKLPNLPKKNLPR